MVSNCLDFPEGTGTCRTNDGTGLWCDNCLAMDTEAIRERLDEFRREDGNHGVADMIYMVTRDVPALLAEVDRLRGAIVRHRDDVHSQEWEGNPADERLWAHLTEGP